MHGLLFITSRLPYPPLGGDRLKNYWTLNILSKHFRIHLVSLEQDKIPASFYTWADELGISYKIFKKNKINSTISVAKSFFNNLPIQVNYYYFKDVQQYIDSMYKNYDLIFPVHIRTSQYVIDKKRPKILDIVDSISVNYKHAKQKATSMKWRLIYKLEQKRLFDYEKYCIEIFDKTIFVNKEESQYYNLPDKVEWIPNGVDDKLLRYCQYDREYNNCVTFFGKMDYQPNIDAVLWFINNVLPKLNKELRFMVVGAYPVKKLVLLARIHKNIIITGYVEDPYKILKSSLCVVAPMQTGGGIQNKILESMALGTINIITSLPSKPIGGVNGKHYIVIDNPDEMAKTINDIWKNPHKYNEIKIESRKYIQNNFTWKIYEERLLKVIENVLNKYQ